MPKTPRVLHESIRLHQNAPTCDVYKPADVGKLAENYEYGEFLISPGLGSVKTDYTKLARRLACQGYVVYSPNCNEALPDTGSLSALERRADVLARLVEQKVGGKFRILAHSIGAPVSFKFLEQVDNGKRKIKNPESITFMQPAGFVKHGPLDLLNAGKFYFDEALPNVSNLLPILLSDPRSIRQRLNIRQRFGEIWDLWNLPENYMESSLKNAKESGIDMNFFVGPKDKLTRSEPIRRIAEPIVGESNVYDIHPEAGHLVAQTHARHMASLILEKLGLNTTPENFPRVA
jgi:hypothetical protein